MRDVSAQPSQRVLANPTSLVLYHDDEWRYAVFSGAAVLDGKLTGSSGLSSADARDALVALVDKHRTQPIAVLWRSSEPGWWNGEVTNLTTTG